MAKGSRGGRRGGGGGTSAKGELVLPNGSPIEFDGELFFDGDDTNIPTQARSSIENWENTRYKNKIEFAYAVTEDGVQIDRERKGGSGSVRVSRAMHDTDNCVFSHNHPRSDGILGGTFSSADLNNFVNYKNKTCRATAKEGTYSISKGANFDKTGFKQYVSDADATFSKNVSSHQRTLNSKYRNNEISYSDYTKMSAKAFNTELVKLHETYRQGQSKYGYTYTLEKRKS